MKLHGLKRLLHASAWNLVGALPLDQQISKNEQQHADNSKRFAHFSVAFRCRSGKLFAVVLACQTLQIGGNLAALVVLQASAQLCFGHRINRFFQFGFAPVMKIWDVTATLRKLGTRNTCLSREAFVIRKRPKSDGERSTGIISLNTPNF